MGKSLIFIFLIVLLTYKSDLYSQSASPVNTSQQAGLNSHDAHLNIPNIDATKFVELITKGEHLILDVRTPNEIKSGKVTDAIEIDYLSTNFKTEIMKLDKSKKYIIYCASGGRSGKSTHLMIENGFKVVLNTADGFQSIQHAINKNK